MTVRTSIPGKSRALPVGYVNIRYQNAITGFKEECGLHLLKVDAKCASGKQTQLEKTSNRMRLAVAGLDPLVPLAPSPSSLVMAFALLGCVDSL